MENNAPEVLKIEQETQNEEIAEERAASYDKLLERLEELEKENSNLKKDKAEPENKQHDSFKLLDVVEILAPWSAEWVPGRVTGKDKTLIVVSTKRGEVTFSPEASGRIRYNAN